MAVSEIFRIFNMAFVETSKAGCAFSLKIGIHMDEQGMLMQEESQESDRKITAMSIRQLG